MTLLVITDSNCDLQNNLTLKWLKARAESNLIAPVFDDQFLKSSNREQHDGNDKKTHPEQEPRHDGDKDACSTTLALHQILQETGFRLVHPDGLLYESWNFRPARRISRNKWEEPKLFLPKISLAARDVTRWKMARHALEEYSQDGRLKWGSVPYKLLIPRCVDWPEISRMAQDPVALGFTAVAAIYGGIHALAWFAYFDSPTEQSLWRISACVMMGGLPAIFVLNSLYAHLHRELSGSRRPDEAIRNFESLILMFRCLLLLAYALARAYLVVECFINLSHLPAGVYDVPRWTTYFPHIS